MSIKCDILCMYLLWRDITCTQTCTCVLRFITIATVSILNHEETHQTSHRIAPMFWSPLLMATAHTWSPGDYKFTAATKYFSKRIWVSEFVYWICKPTTYKLCREMKKLNIVVVVCALVLCSQQLVKGTSSSFFKFFSSNIMIEASDDTVIMSSDNFMIVCHLIGN